MAGKKYNRDNFFHPNNPVGRKLLTRNSLGDIIIDDNFIQLIVSNEKVFNKTLESHFNDYIRRLVGKAGGSVEEKKLAQSLFAFFKSQSKGAIRTSDIYIDARIFFKIDKAFDDWLKEIEAGSFSEFQKELKLAKERARRAGTPFDIGHSVSSSFAYLFGAVASKSGTSFKQLVDRGQKIGVQPEASKPQQQRGAKIERPRLVGFRKAILSNNTTDFLRSTNNITEARNAFWAMILGEAEKTDLLQVLQEKTIKTMKFVTGYLQRYSEVTTSQLSNLEAGNIQYAIPDKRSHLLPNRLYPGNSSTLSAMTLKALTFWNTKYINTKYIQNELVYDLLNIRIHDYPGPPEIKDQ